MNKAHALFVAGSVLMLLGITSGTSFAAAFGIHELVLDGTVVNLTPFPQPVLVGNGTGIAPISPNQVTLDSIAGGSYTTPDTFFTVLGTVEAANINGVASAILSVTVVDNKAVGPGGDVVELVLRQDFLMTTLGLGMASGLLDGDCNTSATQAGSQVGVGVSWNATTVVMPPLSGSCAPLGTFIDSNSGLLQIGPLIFGGLNVDFQFGEGAAGQRISLLPLQVSAAAVPEPATLTLLGIGLVSVVYARRRLPLAERCARREENHRLSVANGQSLRKDA